MSKTSFRRRGWRFLVAGVPITLCDFGAFKLAILASIDPSWARALSFLVAFAFSFGLHRWWTFGSAAPWWRDLSSYFAARIACFLLAQVIFMVLQKGLGIGPDLAFWLQAPVQPIGNFLLGHFIVFRFTSSESSAP
jgi:putative flippase GtrA